MKYKLEHLHNDKWWGVSNNLTEKGMSALLLVCDEHATRYEGGYTYLSLSKLFDNEPYFRVKGENTTTTKKDILLQIKNDIDALYEKKPSALTSSDINSIVDIFSNALIMDKVGETLQQNVADFYKMYNNIDVVKTEIGWRISYRG